MLVMWEETTPAYQHDCDKCQYMFTVCSNGRKVDVYKSCTHGYLLRYGKDADYYSGINLDSLVWSYMQVHDADWREEQN